MRSCAFFIFDAATISMALVILRVLCTLLILLRISFEPAMAFASLPGPVLLEVFDRGSQSLLAFGIELLRSLDLVVELRVLALQERPRSRLEGERLVHRHVVVVATVDREERERLIRDGERRVLRLLHELGDEPPA